MAGKLQIDWDGMAHSIGYINWKDMFLKLYLLRGMSMMKIEEMLGVGYGSLKYHVKKEWPDFKFRPQGRRRHK